jgi:hypothetical protein
MKLGATPFSASQAWQPPVPDWSQPMQRHIAWRRRYDSQRYARHLSQEELNRRIRDIFLNILSLSPEGKIEIGPTPFTDQAAVWIEKFAHMLEEMQLRHGPYPAGFTREILHSEPLPNFASELAGKAAKHLSSRLKPGEVFIKFGKRTCMERLHEAGALRIQPASYFARPDHNGAVRDDELTLSLALALSHEDVLHVVRNPEDLPAEIPEQRVDVKFTSPTDYWLYCVTNSAKPRLFVDFSADACVVIRDRGRFSQMLREATCQHFCSVSMTDGPAEYVDPLLPTKPEVFVPFVKHFRYTYQDEYRFSWVPIVPVQRVTSLDVEIGSLREISELIVL